MIVPTIRLLILYSVIVPALTLIAMLGEEARIAALAAGLLFTIVVLGDALFAGAALRAIDIELPSMVRMTRNRGGDIEITMKNSRAKAKALRIGLRLPLSIKSVQDDLVTVLKKGVEASRISWSCVPEKRGTFQAGPCYIETSSMLGLWSSRSRRDVFCEVRVYPNLEAERKSLAALFLNRGGFGVHAQRLQGKGREFERLREYVPGDGYDEIHWKATARHHRPITKVFQIERTQEVYVMIDASRFSARPQGMKALEGRDESAVNAASSAGGSQLERFIAASLVLGLAAQKQGDLFGVCSFSDSVHSFLRAKGGKAHYGACRESIYALYPRMVNPDYEELFTFIRTTLRKRALIIILTSLDDPVSAESFVRCINLVNRHHLVMPVMFRPAHARPVFSDSAINSMEMIYDELGGHILWHALGELGATLARSGIDLAMLEEEKFCVDLVTRYMSVKQRQIL